MPLLPVVRRLGVLAASAVAGLALLEGYARLADRLGYNSQVVAEATARDRDVLEALRAGRSPFPADARPILVLGDSVAASLGVSQEEAWSTLLGRRLRDRVDPRVVVVNAAVPGANTYQHLLVARELMPLLRPRVVLLIYNTNDVYGTHGLLSGPAPLPMPQPPDAAVAPRPDTGPLLPEDAAVEVGWSSSPLARLTRYLKANSKALEVFLPRVNRTLKSWGYLVPGTDYHDMATNAYLDRSEGWASTRRELAAIRDLCEKGGAKLVVYNIPDFDVLKFDYMAEIRGKLGDYLRSIGVPAGFGQEHFRGRSAEELAISPFDGHPNPKANRELAEVIAAWLAEVGALSDSKAAARTPE